MYLDFGSMLLITALYRTLNLLIRQTYSTKANTRLNELIIKKGMCLMNSVCFVNLHNQKEDLGNRTCEVCKIFGEAAFK